MYNNNNICKLVKNYVKDINEIFTKNNGTEYSYRRYFGNFLSKLIRYEYPKSNYNFFEEHKHYKNKYKYKNKIQNAPDYTIYNNNIPEGVIETKLPNADLYSNTYHNQFSRYKRAFSFVIFSNYLEFSIWSKSKHIIDLKIGRIIHDSRGFSKITCNNKSIQNSIKLAQYIYYEKLSKITSSRQLAITMANLSKILSSIVYKAINYDSHNHINSHLIHLYNVFNKTLITVKLDKFADYFAQTVTYGMLSARLNTNDNVKFTRQRAINDVPRSDPFLRELFTHVTGNDIDYRIKWIVNRIVRAFGLISKQKILKSFNQTDPLINFYETFLNEFDKKVRRDRGVWYTPRSIVNFIVNSIDFLLQKELKITNGLACSSQIKVPVYDPKSGEIYKYVSEPKIQILDPASGTGTFLSETIRRIYLHFKKSGLIGLWPKYVKENLLNQLNAFEILMASYAVSHLKLYLTLKNTLNNSINLGTQRFNIFLTNALTPSDQGNKNSRNEKDELSDYDLIDPYITDEWKGANRVKHTEPIMVIMSNPPYNGKSQNNNEWINGLLSTYTTGMKNETLNGVYNDYVKFIRLAEYYINKKGYGIVGYITDASYLFGKSFRTMRNDLAKEFDDIYVINLHGGDREGIAKDKNVFDITIPVAISIFVKRKKEANGNSTIHYMDITGSRSKKYKILNGNSVCHLKFHNWIYKYNTTFIYQKNIKNDNYNKFISIKDIFNIDQNGIITGNNNAVIYSTKKEEDRFINDLRNYDEKYLIRKYNIKDTASWHLTDAKQEAKRKPFKSFKINFKPLDYQYIPYTLKASSNKLLYRPCTRDMSNMMLPNALGLVVPRQLRSKNLIFNHAIVTNTLITSKIYKGDLGGGFVFPLQINLKLGTESFYGNFSIRFLKAINKRLTNKCTLTSYHKCKDVLAWIVGILNAPQFVKKYNSKLKLSFPKIPLPTNQYQFNIVSDLGNKLIDAFTLNVNKCPNNIGFPKDGSYKIMKYGNIRSVKLFHKSSHRLYINSKQYFTNVSSYQYNFNLGGYSIVKQWIYDRRGTRLQTTDILNLIKILKAINIIINIRKELKQLSFINKF